MKRLIFLTLSTLCAASFAQVPDYVPTEGLVAWYPLSGSGVDEGLLENHLQILGATPTTDRFMNESEALYFDGGATLDETGFDGIGENSSHTISFWETHSSIHNGCILSENGGYSTGEKLHYCFRGPEDGVCIDGGCMGLDFYNSQHFTSFTAELDTWNHWVLTYESTSQNSQIFFNGILVSEQPMPTSWTGTFDDGICIGAFCQAGVDASHFVGSIDEFGIWDRQLSPLEIQTLYNGEPVSQVPDYVSNDGLVAWYSFDSNLDDAGPNNHDGQSDSFGFGEDVVGEAESSLRLELGEFVSLGMEDKLLNNGQDTLSISFWSKPDENGLTTVSKYVNFEPEQSSWEVFDIESSGVRALGNGFEGNDVTWFSNCPNVTSEWSHVAAIYTPGTVSLWINGEFTCETSVPNSNVTDPQPILVGRSNCDGDNCNDASGLIDNLGFWDRALTPEEIQALYDTEPIEQTSQYVPDSVLVSEGWTLVLEREGHQYWLFDEDREWEEARAMCEALGAYLYWPNSMEEHEAVWESVPKGNDDIHYWTAIHQDFSTVECSDPNGGWSGPNGEPQTFFLWAPGEPSDANNKESVVQFEWDIQGNQWNDAPGQACDEGNNCACRFSRVILERANDLGCTDASACNYDEAASLDDGSCDYSCCPGPGCCHAGTVWDVALQQCVVAEPAYLNEPGEAAVLNPCYFDSDDDGLVDVNDLMNLLTVYNLACGDAPETTASWQCGDPLEYQGYDYATVQIGEQCWFAENLRAENYRNGDAIPANLSDGEWSSTSIGAVAVYGEGSSVCDTTYSDDGIVCNEDWSLNEYGRLYNWFGVDDARGLCPTDWHVPSSDEWTVMTNELGGESTAGIKMKNTYGWNSGGNGTNSSGFSGFPGGRGQNPNNDAWRWNFAGEYGWWWTSSDSEVSDDDALNVELYQLDDELFFLDTPKNWQYSIRCIKDAE